MVFKLFKNELSIEQAKEKCWKCVTGLAGSGTLFVLWNMGMKTLAGADVLGKTLGESNTGYLGAFFGLLLAAAISETKRGESNDKIRAMGGKPVAEPVIEFDPIVTPDMIVREKKKRGVLRFFSRAGVATMGLAIHLMVMNYVYEKEFEFKKSKDEVAANKETKKESSGPSEKTLSLVGLLGASTIAAAAFGLKSEDSGKKVKYLAQYCK